MASRKSQKRPANRAASASPFAFILDGQMVIAMRLTRIAGGGRQAYREAERMVTEKIEVAITAHAAAGAALALGEPALAADRYVATYRRALIANRQRLSRAT